MSAAAIPSVRGRREPWPVRPARGGPGGSAGATGRGAGGCAGRGRSRRSLADVRRGLLGLAVGVTSLFAAAQAVAQQVCLPLPRLLTVTPMGGQAGTSVEVAITHQHVDAARELLFSTHGITATPVLAADGRPVPDRFLVTIAADAPLGVHDARIVSRLGVSAPRAFAVGDLREIVRTTAHTSIATAFPLPLNSVCNATATERAIDVYSFQMAQGGRVVVDVSTVGIDSKLQPVVIVADARGNDLLVSRDGGVIDFTPPEDGTYLVKVHGLAYQGGSEQFYRLSLREVSGSGPAPRQAGARRVSAFSWPPEGLSAGALTQEAEPNDASGSAQTISLPCDISGSFVPAADTDVFEFEAKKGEAWWVEVASERLGMDTDPFVLVQRVTRADGRETVTDVAELDDIAHPMKPGDFIPASSYNGPPYVSGSPDVLGRITIPEDGTYRLRLRDLLGGPGTDPGSIYRLVVRQAAPDFALVAWPAHLRLRQNDFGTFSKPIALRAGGTMALEVVVVRRDGFDGAIDLVMDGLPSGVRAAGLTIPAGRQQGMLFVTAAETATPALSTARIFGRSRIDGVEVTRPCPLASVVWAIDYAPNDFPRSRLTADVPVSVTDFEKAPASIAPAEHKVWEAQAGTTLKIPLKIEWREPFNGASIRLTPFGTVFTGVKPIDLPLQAATAEVVLDLAALKTPPGEHVLAFSAISVVKHRANSDIVRVAEEEQKRASEEVAALTAAAKELAERAAQAPDAAKVEAADAARIATEKQKAAEAGLARATAHVKVMTAAAGPQDILDFLVSEPIRISVKPAPPPADKESPKT